MMTQEEFMDVVRMHAEGMTFTEIADATGYHRQTIAKWVKAGGPPPRRRPPTERVADDRWRARIADLIREQPALLSTSIFDVLAAEGFGGSYATVVRAVRELRGPRFKAARAVSLPIETPPGAEAQFDFADVTETARGWGWDVPVLWCFGMILCWSRWRRWWFTTSVDREHTFAGIVGFVEAAGGVPRIARTDRMGALGVSQGRRFGLHPPTLAFARHYGLVIQACQAGDAKRKGKVERPFRQLREGFLTEQSLDPPTSLVQLNERAGKWLERRVHAVAHRVTKVPPATRVETERPLLLPLPPVRFDTAYREPRRVHPAIPLINWRGVRYSVPTRALGQTVEVHQPVDQGVFTIRWAGQTIATHTQAASGSDDVWDADHHAEAVHAALTAATGRHLHPVTRTVEASAADEDRLEVGDGFDVAVPDLNLYAHDLEPRR